MKKHKICIYLSGLACILLLAGCRADEEPQEPVSAGSEDGSAANTAPQSGEAGGAEDTPAQGSETGEQDSEGAGNTALPERGDSASGAGQEPGEGESFVQSLRIVDGAQTGDLVLAGEDGSSVYTLFLGEGQDGTPSGIPVFLDGEAADWTALEDGMMVELSFDGSILETYPGQFGTVYSVSAYSLGTRQNPGGGYYDLCGLYLQVLDDLWEKDPGLNGGAEEISVDLSEAPGGLTEGEKSAVAWIFGCKQGVMALSMTREELIREGYLTRLDNGSELYQWDNGILLRITAAEQEGSYSLPVLSFNAEKWRSPRGAYFFGECTAVWPEMGTWSSYEVGTEAIS